MTPRSKPQPVEAVSVTRRRDTELSIVERDLVDEVVFDLGRDGICRAGEVYVDAGHWRQGEIERSGT